MTTQNFTTLSDLLFVGTASHPALIVPEGGLVVTYSSLQAQVERLAARLQELGIGRGDRVAMALPNGIEVITMFLAVGAAAATAAPLNPAYTTDEFRFYLEDIEAKVLLVPPGGAEQARAAAPAVALLVETTLSSNGQIDLVPLRKSPFTRKQATPTSEDVTLFLHTSGTTSRPKGVPLSHGNLLTSAANVVATYVLTPDDVSLCVMPLFH